MMMNMLECGWHARERLLGGPLAACLHTQPDEASTSFNGLLGRNLASVQVGVFCCWCSPQGVRGLRAWCQAMVILPYCWRPTSPTTLFPPSSQLLPNPPSPTDWPPLACPAGGNWKCVSLSQPQPTTPWGCGNL